MSRIEMAFFEAILYCQQLEFRGVPSDLCVLETRRSNLYNTGFPVTVFLEQDEAQPVDRGIGHRMQGIALFIGLQMLELGQVLYHVVKLLLVGVCPVELGAFVC